MHNKINRFSIYSALIVAFMAQLLFLDYVKIGGAKPDLFVMLVVFFSIFFGPVLGIEAGLVSGLFKDIYSLDIFGVNTLTLSLTGFIAGVVSPKFFRESKFTQAMLVFAFSILSMIVHYYALSIMSKTVNVGLAEYLFSLFIPSSLYTSVLSVFIFPFLINAYGLKKSEEYL